MQDRFKLTTDLGQIDGAELERMSEYARTRPNMMPGSGSQLETTIGTLYTPPAPAKPASAVTDLFYSLWSAPNFTPISANSPTVLDVSTWTQGVHNGAFLVNPGAQNIVLPASQFVGHGTLWLCVYDILFLGYSTTDAVNNWVKAGFASSAPMATAKQPQNDPVGASGWALSFSRMFRGGDTVPFPQVMCGEAVNVTGPAGEGTAGTILTLMQIGPIPLN